MSGSQNGRTTAERDCAKQERYGLTALLERYGNPAAVTGLTGRKAAPRLPDNDRQRR